MSAKGREIVSWSNPFDIHMRSMCTRTESPPVRMSPGMLIAREEHKNTMLVYVVTVMTEVIALDARQSSQGTYELITPVLYTLCD